MDRTFKEFKKWTDEQKWFEYSIGKFHMSSFQTTETQIHRFLTPFGLQVLIHVDKDGNVLDSDTLIVAEKD